MALLAAAAAVVVFREEITGWEKLLWSLLLVGFLTLEFVAIDKDRVDHEREQAAIRKEESEHFAQIADRITQAVKENETQFVTSMGRSNRIIARVEDSIKVNTGGDSFAYITFTPEPAILQFGNISHGSEPWFLVSITSHGRYPLREVHATLMDDDKRLIAMQEYNKHPTGDWIQAIRTADTEYLYPYLRPQSPEGPSGDVEALGAYPLPQGSSKRLTIAFSSLNGYWNEVLHLGLVGGAWHQCLSVIGPTVKQAKSPFVYCDANWPEGKALAKKDWAPTKSAPTRAN